MALNGCSGGLLATALLTVLLLPAHYYVPDFGSNQLSIDPALLQRDSLLKPRIDSWISLDFPPFDIFLTFALILWATVTYLCDWIQRKLMEKRILKLNEYLRGCAQRVREWDARHEQVEATLRMVHNATAEYNLLLYLLLQRRKLLAERAPAASAHPHPSCFFDKDFEDINFITKPTIEV